MFAKLKKKVLEEGEAGGPELVPFSPRKLPGGAVAVRSPPEVPSLSGGTESESESVRGEGKVDGVTVKQKEEEKEEVKPLESVSLHPTVLPSHLQSSLTQEAVHQELLTKIAQQQHELDVLGQKLQEVERDHNEQREKWRDDTAARLANKNSEIQVLQSRFDKVDEVATELKLQVVELQLEKADCEQHLEGEITQLKECLSTVEREKEEGEKAWSQKREELENRVTELEEAFSDEEFQVESLKDQVKSLETFKVESLSNMVEASKDDVLLKLQNEIIDLERRLQSRTMDIEMARIESDTQMRWKEEQLQEGVTRQLSLMAVEKELRETVSEKNEELRELRQGLERERTEGERKEREVARLTGELDTANKTVEQLEQKTEEAQSAHDRHLQEMAAQRDARVAELSKALEELRGDILGSETVTSPERNPLDFTSVATQTDAPPPPPAEEQRENGCPAILRVDTFPDTSLNINGMGGSEGEEGEEKGAGSPTMQSHGLIEELQTLRQEQLRLQEEVMEKNKLVRFQQLKIVDMRKALNKELRSQTSLDSGNHPPSHHSSHSHAFPFPPSNPWPRGNGGTSPMPTTPGGRITGCGDVNVQYLKHVIIKFLCSREDEATQLIRAVSTLLDFTRQEEQFVKDYFDYKMSWFGSMPQPLYRPVKQNS